MFLGGFVVAGLDFRFGWSVMPPWVVITASVLFLLAYALYAEVHAGECLLEPHHPGGGGTDGGGHGPLWHCPSSYVCSDTFAVFYDPTGAWLLVCPNRFCLLPGDHNRTVAGRGKAADQTVARLCRI